MNDKRFNVGDKVRIPTNTWDPNLIYTVEKVTWMGFWYQYDCAYYFMKDGVRNRVVGCGTNSDVVRA